MLARTHQEQTTPRAVAEIFRGAGIHWVGDGFRVTSVTPPDAELVEKMNPFLLLDYHAPYRYPPTSNLRRGVGPHPHRGFETVSLAFEGSVAHHDSTGSGGVIGPGDVQWMTAGSGILHREYHAEAFARAGGVMHFAQLWVNLPRAYKMHAPRYQALAAAEMGRVELPDAAGTVRVIAGAFAGARGPAKTFTPIELYDAELAAQGRLDLTLPAQHNTGLLVLSGQVTVGGQTAGAGDFVLMDGRGEAFTVTAAGASRLLVLSGQPIDEPVVQYGPFVMNSAHEIDQAIQDFNAGQFGHLAE